MYPYSSVPEDQDLPSAVPSSPRDSRPESGSSTSIFKNATHTRIRDSTFNVVNNNMRSPAESIDKLFSRVASNAILNAGGRADEVKCYPGTRTEVIGLIERWMENGGPNMLWLSGPAGAGKSAIVQTIAERCTMRGVHAPSFFFFRNDPTRSSAKPFVATLLYQILKFYPSVRDAVANVLAYDPLLLDASIQDQLDQLLCTPLRGIPHQLLKSPARRPIVILIDGLDECDSEHKASQRRILQALDHLVLQPNSPFLVLVASRAEPQITMGFKQLRSPVQSIFLDDQYSPEKDIRIFVNGEFNEIRRSHHLAHTLDDNWPSKEDTESIVKKSTGQFIFAATVMRYIANSTASPKLSFERVRGIQPITTNSPFAHLDAIYSYIFSQVDDQDAVMDRLSIDLLNKAMGERCDSHLFDAILRAYNPRYTPELLNSCMSDLTAVVKLDGSSLAFFHASLSDFLKDKSRSGKYHIDFEVFGAKILPAIWMMVPDSPSLLFFGIKTFNSLKTPTPDITKALLTISPSSAKDVDKSDVLATSNRVFHTIYRLYYNHDSISYAKIMGDWVSWYVCDKPSRQLNQATRSLPYVTTYILFSHMKNLVAGPLKRLYMPNNDESS